MAYRTVRQIVDGVELAEGAGARVIRAIGTPQLPDLDPFVLLDEAFIRPDAGFPEHAHRGFEIVTYLFRGAMGHRDSTGQSAVVRAGDVAHTVAGRGVSHSEMPTGGETVHGLQLWVNLPGAEKQIEPDYRRLVAAEVPETRQYGAVVRTLIGEGSPIELHTPVQYWDVRLVPGGAFQHNVAPDDTAFVYVVEGAGRFGSDQTLGQPGQLLIFGEGETVLAASEQEVHFVCLAGKPLGEPIRRVGGVVE